MGFKPVGAHLTWKRYVHKLWPWTSVLTGGNWPIYLSFPEEGQATGQQPRKEISVSSGAPSPCHPPSCPSKAAKGVSSAHPLGLGVSEVLIVGSLSSRLPLSTGCLAGLLHVVCQGHPSLHASLTWSQSGDFQGSREKEEEDCPPWLSPLAACAGPGQNCSLDLHPGISCVWQATEYLGQHYLSPRVYMSRKLS